MVADEDQISRYFKHDFVMYTIYSEHIKGLDSGKRAHSDPYMKYGFVLVILRTGTL